MGLTTLPPSCVDCLKIWQPQSCHNLGVCPGLYRDYFNFILICFCNGYSSLKKLAYDYLRSDYCTEMGRIQTSTVVIYFIVISLHFSGQTKKKNTQANSVPREHEYCNRHKKFSVARTVLIPYFFVCLVSFWRFFLCNYVNHMFVCFSNRIAQQLQIKAEYDSGKIQWKVYLSRH